MASVPFLNICKPNVLFAVLEPAYDCYAPQIRLVGGVPVPVPLELAACAKSSADYHVNLAAIEAKITDRTKFIVINNPHNPTGKLFSRCKDHSNLSVLLKHLSLLWQRKFLIFPLSSHRLECLHLQGPPYLK